MRLENDIMILARRTAGEEEFCIAQLARGTLILPRGCLYVISDMAFKESQALKAFSLRL
jgi:hypothetical protein